MGPGIDLHVKPLKELREKTKQAAENISGPSRIIVFGCGHTVPQDSNSDSVATVRVPCISMLPPSFIDYTLSRDLADGVLLSGCRRGECHYRLGPKIMEERIDRKRDPGLPRRVPRERVDILWASALGRKDLDKAISGFSARLKEMSEAGTHKIRKRKEGEKSETAITEGAGND